MKLQQQSSSCSSRSDYRTIYIMTFDQNAIKERSRGLMDKALPSGGKDCEFESCRDRFFLPFFPFVPGTACGSSRPAVGFRHCKGSELHFTKIKGGNRTYFSISFYFWC